MRSSTGRLAFLSLLYFVQGLPFGFQAQALSVYLREQGVPLTHIGLAGLLATPWALKALWAPFVDRHGSERFGRRKSWIVPMQALMACAMVAAALVPPEEGLVPLLWLVLAMNLCAATMDIAVDGLAVEILSGGELGHGNAAQVVGYKLGMLAGGGVMLWASAYLPWHALFGAMAALVLVAMAITLRVEEPRVAHAEHDEARPEARTMRAVVAQLREALRAPGTPALLVAVVGYKMGEALIEPMWSPFLRDHGVPRETIGLYVGTIGMASGIAGSLGGGALAARVPLPRALSIVAALRVVGLAGQAALALSEAPPHALVALSTAAEHLFSGALTTVMFALMMSKTDRRIGATHYTLLATVEVLGKSPLSLASGAIADALGYPAGFAIGVGLALGYLGVLALPAVRRGLAVTPAPAAPAS
jgi:MFS family permease